MKTVQECLKELDVEDLIDTYLNLEPLCREMVAVMKQRDNIIARDLWLKYRDTIRTYIEYMRDLPIITSDEQSILYVYESASSFIYNKFFHGLVHVSELEKKGVGAEDYSYTLCRHGEVAGFLVADTKRTQDNLLPLMADVLYEASFYGYTKEDLDKAIAEMEAEDEDTNTEEDAVELPKEDLYSNDLEKSALEPKSTIELELADAYRKASANYSNFFRQRALREVFLSVFCDS